MPRQSKAADKIHQADDRLANVLNVVQQARRTRTTDADHIPAPGEVVEILPVEIDGSKPVAYEMKAPIERPLPDKEGISGGDKMPRAGDGSFEELALYRIPLSRIEVGGINTRVIDEESPDFLQLVENIQQYGQLEAVWVGVEEDHFRLIAGERRYRALKLLGVDTVLAKIVHAPREDWPILMLIENLQRKDMTAWEEAHGYQALLDSGLTLDEIGQRVGRTKGHVSTVLKIARNPIIMAALEDGRISSMSLAREMSVLVDRAGQEIQDGMIARVLDHVARRSPTIIELRKWIQVQWSVSPVEQSTTSRRRRQVARGTFLRNEEQHLATITSKLPQLSSKEIEMLAQIYEEQAQRLRLVARDVIEDAADE